MIDKLYFSSTDNFLFLVFWQGMWFNAGTIFITVLVVFAFYKTRVNKLKNQKAEFAQEALKQRELLMYASENEQRAREDLKRASETKRELLSKISHDIRTPMNGVIGMTTLLQETSLTAEQREYCETIRNCGESLLSTINDILFDDILASSKIDSGKMELEKDFDLRNSIEDTLDVFTNKAAQGGVELVYQVDRDVPSVIVAHSLWIRQILMNLVENAVRFTKQGEVIIKVKVAKTSNENAMELDFEVSDTGMGMPPEKVSLLNKGLSQPDTSIRGQQGVRLGLAICKKLVNVMGGKMTLESTDERGTVVRFTLQVKRGQTAFQNHILHTLKGKRILIVDDNLPSLNALKNQIEDWNLVAVTAASGKEALEILTKVSDFDLVLTDMTMPELDGVATAHAIRKQFSHIPIILLSVDGEKSFVDHPGLFNAVVNKPIKYHVLSEHIFSSLRHIGGMFTVEEQFSKPKLSTDFAQHYPLRILIAEDDRVNQKLATRVLGKLGYNPDIAQNGKEVLEVVSQVKYDVVLMDVEMPEMDGLEATRMIRLCLATQPIIIAMTANAMQGDREECIRVGMDDYISKPVNIEELIILLEKWALQIRHV